MLNRDSMEGAGQDMDETEEDVRRDNRGLTTSEVVQIRRSRTHSSIYTLVGFGVGSAPSSIYTDTELFISYITRGMSNLLDWCLEMFPFQSC